MHSLPSLDGSAYTLVPSGSAPSRRAWSISRTPTASAGSDGRSSLRELCRNRGADGVRGRGGMVEHADAGERPPSRRDGDADDPDGDEEHRQRDQDFLPRPLRRDSAAAGAASGSLRLGRGDRRAQRPGPDSPARAARTPLRSWSSYRLFSPDTHLVDGLIVVQSLSKPTARASQPNAIGRRCAAEHLRSLLRAEPVPGSKKERLLVECLQAPQRLQHRRPDTVDARTRGLQAKTRDQRIAALVGCPAAGSPSRVAPRRAATRAARAAPPLDASRPPRTSQPSRRPRDPCQHDGGRRQAPQRQSPGKDARKEHATRSQSGASLGIVHQGRECYRVRVVGAPLAPACRNDPRSEVEQSAASRGTAAARASSPSPLTVPAVNVRRQQPTVGGLRVEMGSHSAPRCPLCRRGRPGSNRRTGLPSRRPVTTRRVSPFGASFGST